MTDTRDGSLDNRRRTMETVDELDLGQCMLVPDGQRHLGERGRTRRTFRQLNVTAPAPEWTFLDGLPEFVMEGQH